MFDVLFWIYLVNAVLLINHEIESGYWQEWRLFKMSGDISGFLILHFPLIFILLFGLVQVYQETLVGLILSLVFAASGLFAFVIHIYFIRKGNREFTLRVSLFILFGTLILSLFQFGVTIYLLVT